jgi:hypothetical protein
VPSTGVTLVNTPHRPVTCSPKAPNSGPVTSRATAPAGSVPAAFRPRLSQGWTATQSASPGHFAFPDPELVEKPALPAPSVTTHTGVETGALVWRRVVGTTYLSSPRVMFGAHRSAPGSLREASRLVQEG